MKINRLDIFEILETQERLKKELFDMVYKWGLWNVETDYQAPAFQMKIKMLSKYLRKEKI